MPWYKKCQRNKLLLEREAFMLKLLIKILILNASLDAFFEKASIAFGKSPSLDRDVLVAKLQELYGKLYGLDYRPEDIEHIYEDEPYQVMIDDIRSLENLLRDDEEYS